MYNDPNQNQPNQPPPYGQPPQAPYNQPPYGQPQQEPFGQQPTQYMAPPGQPPYGVPPYAPEQQPKPRRRRRILWIVLGIIVVLLLAVGAIALFSFVTNNGATSAVNQYYMAVEQQDYATAYTYLDTSGIGPNGQSLTQALYQAIDIARGKVSSYSITSTSINPNNGVNTAAITVNVTRNGQSYDVHLQLKQESNGWKIVRTDNI